MSKTGRVYLILSLFVLGLINSDALSAQGIIPTKGKEFWLGFMENANGSQTLDLFVSADQNTTGTLSMPGAGLSIPFAVVANVTTTVTVPAAWGGEHIGSEVIETKGLFVETQDTVSLFAINFQSFTADGTKVLPTKSLGIDYRVNSCYGLPGFSNFYKPEMLIIATEDGTQVEITSPIVTLGGQAAGVPWIVDLDAGESYQVQGANSTDDLTGATVVATDTSGTCRPFAVFSGVMCTNMPSNCTACDHLFEQNFPRETWGTKYYTVPFTGATTYTYRVMADQNNTSVTVNGGAPFILNAGQFVETNSFVPEACIEGNKPISVVQFMEGVTCTGAGDPAMLILNSEEQKISNITFSTVASAVITQHNLNVIMETTNINQLTLDGALVPPASFSVYPTCPGHSYAQLPLTPGSHTLDAAGGFTAYVYGTGNAESYAYSVGSFSNAPPINIDSVLCTTDTLTLGAPPGLFDPFWTTVSNPNDTLHFGPVYTFVPTTSDIYVVTGNQFISGCVEEYFFSVELPDPPVLTLTSSSPVVCAYTDVQLNVSVTPNSSVYQYTWSPSAELNDPNIPNPVASPSATTWYSVAVSTPSGCGYTLDSILVTVTPGNVLDLEATTAQDFLCLGDSSQLDVVIQQIIFNDAFDGGITAGIWDNVTGGVSNTSCGSVSGDALYFDGAPPTRQAETNDMDVSAGGIVQFALKIANGVAPCENADPGENIVLEYSINGGGIWTTMSTYLESNYPVFTNIIEPIPLAAQTPATRFRWRQIAFTAAGEDNWALDNANVAVDDNTGMTYAWTPTADVSDPAIADPMSYPSQTGWFYVDVVDNNTTCDYIDSVFIDVGLPFSITVTPDTALCDVAGIQLDAAPSSGTGHTWDWTPANGTLSSELIQDPIATPAITTMYYVTVTSGQGCTASDSVNIVVNQLLNLSVMANDSAICQGDSAYLTAVVANPAGLAFSWDPILGLDDPFSQTPAASPPSTTNYIVTVTDTATGCQLVDSLEIIISTAYFANALPDTNVCTAIGLPLDVTHNVPNPQYTWQPAQYLNNAGIQMPIVQFDSTMQYIVTVEDAIGCSISDTVNVTVSFDDLQFISDSSICEGDSMVIDAGYPGSTYDWSTSEVTQTITVFTAAPYTVVITDAFGCQTTFTTNVTVDPLPLIDLGPDTSLCDLEIMDLDAGNPGSQYLWSTTETTQTIQLVNDHYAWVQVTDQNMCVNSDTVDVTFDPLPVISLSDTTVCISETIVLDAQNPGSTYSWSTAESTQTISVNSTGIYEVIVTTADLCSDSAEADITMIEFPIVDLGPDTALCDTEVFTMDAGNPGDTYSWSTGATSQTLSVQTTDIYSVSVFNGYCTSYDSVDVVFNPLPIESLIESATACFSMFPKEMTLDAGNSGSSFEWSTNETSQTIIVNDYGTYVVDITTPLNCTITDEVLIEEFCPAALYVPNAFTPDGDGTNDVFTVNGENIASLNMMIFDRWGELIYEDDQGIGWDGTISGAPVQDGVYAWRITYRFFTDLQGTMGTENEQMGHITLVR